MHKTIYTKRLLARIVLESKSPLALGSGEKNHLTDAAVARDINGLPYIPGTSLAGVLRHAAEDSTAYDLFGKYGDSNGEGSKLIFSDARIVDCDGKVIDGIMDSDRKSDFLKHFDTLPIRHHARINDMGSTVDQGKFDNEVVYAGTRFCFDMELVAEDKEVETAGEILSQLGNESFRIGGGTRKGYGAISVVKCSSKVYDLCNASDLEAYLKKSSSLSEEWIGNDYHADSQPEGIVKYELTLKAEDFHIFASGHGDNDADTTSVTEDMVVWENENSGRIEENCFLIPASSIKGALAHRITFHMNKKCERYADVSYTMKNPAEYNEAVLSLFGNEDVINSGKALRGAALFSDVILKQNKASYKLFNHVSIDTFTSAGINGALYNEKSCYKSPEDIKLTIIVKVKDFESNFDVVKSIAPIPAEDEEIFRARIWESLENSLDDICQGRLQLGGLVNKGHGRFNGTWNKKVYENQ